MGAEACGVPGGGGWCCFCGGVVWHVHLNASPCLPPPVSCVQLAPQGRPSLPEQVRLSTHMLSRFDGCTQLLPIRRKVTHFRVWRRKPFPFNGPKRGSQQQHPHMHPHAENRLVYLLWSRVHLLPALALCMTGAGSAGSPPVFSLVGEWPTQALRGKLFKFRPPRPSRTHPIALNL